MKCSKITYIQRPNLKKITVLNYLRKYDFIKKKTSKNDKYSEKSVLFFSFCEKITDFSDNSIHPKNMSQQLQNIFEWCCVCLISSKYTHFLMLFFKLMYIVVCKMGKENLNYKILLWNKYVRKIAKYKASCQNKKYIFFLYI